MSDLPAIVLGSRWPDPKVGPWQLEFTWAVVDGSATCVGMSVFGGVHPITREEYQSHNVRGYGVRELPGGARAVRSSVLRDIPLGQEAQFVLALFETVIASLMPDLAHELQAKAIEDAATYATKDRLKRGGWPADHLQRVAEFYAERVRLGDTAPTSAVAEKWMVSKSAAAKWIGRCRRADPPLLGPTEKGRAGGLPIPEKPQPKRRSKR